MKPYVVYISGPMQDKPDFNFPQFCEAEEWLRGSAAHFYLGTFATIEVINPARNFGGDTSLGRELYLELALRQVDDATAIMLLPGWEESAGSRLELARALHNGCTVYEWHPAQGAIYQPVFLPISHTAARERLEETAIPMEAPVVVQTRRGPVFLEASEPEWPEPPAGYKWSDLDVKDLGGFQIEWPAFDGEPKITRFASGATRDTQNGKLDYEGFLSPAVLERYAEYMNKHRTQSDGKLRDADNWQKGFTRASYMKSMWRHFLDSWKNHRGIKTEATHEDALCGVIFNASGYLFELLQGRDLQE